MRVPSASVRREFAPEEFRITEESRIKDDEVRLDSARQALSALMGRAELARPAAIQKEVMLPEMVGGSEPMRELARLIRLVAPRSKNESGVRLITAMIPNEPGGHARPPSRSVRGRR